MRVSFTPLTEEDLPYVKEIYDYYTLNTNVVYYLEPVSIEELKSYVPVGNPQYPSFLMHTETGERCGFCYFSRFKPREAYRISVEITVYLHPGYTGRGYGREALEFLEPIIRKNGFSSIIALIDSENHGSIKLFERQGYSCCAHLREVAEKFGKKLDVKFYQKLLKDVE